jgi:DHA1 family bicyclomycin/chloramphenicol resistance-like MFS transporter
MKKFGFILLLSMLTMSGPFAIDAFLPAIPAIADYFQVSLKSTQYALTFYMFSFAIMMLWHGPLSDAIGRRPVVISAMAIFTLASIGCALAPSYGFFLTMRALQGLSSSAGGVIAMAVVRDRFRGKSAQNIFSQMNMLFALAPAIAPTVGGILYTGFGWRAVFIFMACWAFFLFIVSFILLKESHPSKARQPLAAKTLMSNYLTIFKSKNFLLLALAIACGNSGFFVYVPAAPVFIIHHLGLPPTAFIWLFGPAVLGMMLGAFTSSRLATHYRNQQILRAGFVIQFLAAAFNVLFHLWYPPMLPISVLPLGVFCFGTALCAPALTMALTDIFPEMRGTASSMLGFSRMMMSGLVASFVSPMLWDHVATLAMGTLFMATLGFLAYWCYQKNTHQPVAQSD